MRAPYSKRKWAKLLIEIDPAISTRPDDPNPNPTRIFGYGSGKFGFGSKTGQPVWPELNSGRVWVDEIRVGSEFGSEFGSGSGQKRVDPCFHHSFCLYLEIRVGFGFDKFGSTQIRVGFGSTRICSGRVRVSIIRVGSNSGWPVPDPTRPVCQV